eukprot:TRINITY_DN6412_c0_g1_i1.p1 TRINITY_DN6412_c0_g1~~TRINITY_DN6412_c0_g1_i1.p1  ORF type:complete len:100 (+),score=16.51 TRINITY_DN6412_c0_g1_i1:40-300(+)
MNKPTTDQTNKIMLEAFKSFLFELEWSLLLIMCLTLGLAPFTPQPHLFEKLGMLRRGTLTKPIDIFDLLMHGTPFILAAWKYMLHN